MPAGFLSAILTMKLPGSNSIYLSQNLKFLAPVKIGGTVKAEVEVLEKHIDKNSIVFGSSKKSEQCHSSKRKKHN